MNRDYRVTDPEKRKEYEQQLEQLRKLALVEITNPDYHITTAINHLCLGNLDQSINSASSALLLKSDSFLGWELLATIYFEKEMYPEAYTAFNTAVDNWEKEDDKEKHLPLAHEIFENIAECAKLIKIDKEEVSK